MMSEPKAPKKEMMEEEEGPKQVYMGTNKTLNKGEVLQFDNKAYDMLHRLNVEWPSMSIDFVAKASPFDPALTNYLPMTNYPYEVFTIQGSCNNSAKNSIYFTKWSGLCQTKYDDDP
jgi:ribosome assembly protein RRB1